MLFDKMNDNYLTDVCTVNQPADLNEEPPEETNEKGKKKNKKITYPTKIKTARNKKDEE